MKVRLALATVLIISLGLGGCLTGRVGERIVTWDQAHHSVPHALPTGATVLRSEAEWQEWLATLPAEMRDERADAIARVDMEGAVLVIAVWGKCTEHSSLHRHGRGEVELRVRARRRVACEWSPLQVEVWRVSLSSLSVSDPADVTIYQD